MQDNNKKLRRQQLLDKYKRLGFSGLSEHERLELLLIYARCENAASLASDLLGEYGSVNALVNADPHLLMKDSRINENTAVLLKLIPCISRSLYTERFVIRTISDTDSAERYFSSHFIGAVGEKLIITAVSKKFRVCSSKILASGTTDRVSASYRDIADFVVKTDCTIFFTAHNHPGSSSAPSEADIVFTSNLIASLSKLGAVLADHIIVGTDGSLSLRKSGLIREMTASPIKGYKLSEQKEP
ncbi:JAB domain-containing protein [Ruminococcus sp.]|uniref:JAB domain-containing protein n=1 Tax=Ruminococcus sp. TaxID=41978 RepID=UPI0025D29097|nr:JAB domain-containing protein [Ruminococcus sp.]